MGMPVKPLEGWMIRKGGQKKKAAEKPPLSLVGTRANCRRLRCSRRKMRPCKEQLSDHTYA